MTTVQELAAPLVPDANGINTARFTDMNIGRPADWEIVRLGA